MSNRRSFDWVFSWFLVWLESVDPQCAIELATNALEVENRHRWFDGPRSSIVPGSGSAPNVSMFTA
jgi:hypothetical protein